MKKPLIALILAVSTVAAFAKIHTEEQANTPSYHETQIFCLASNIYHEARGESYKSQLRVAAITLARVKSKRYPPSVCRVVYQHNQFSWTRNLHTVKKPKGESWEKIKRLAADAYWHRIKLPNLKKCEFFYKRTDDKGTGFFGRQFFASLIPIAIFDNHTSYSAKKCE